MQLNTNTRTKVIDMTGHDFHPRFQAMTTNLFPEFKPLVDDFGGCLAIPLCKIPDSVYMDPHGDKFWGKMKLKMPEFIGNNAVNPNELITFEVRAILLYKDLKLIKNEFSSRQVLELLR